MLNNNGTIVLKFVFIQKYIHDFLGTWMWVDRINFLLIVSEQYKHIADLTSKTNYNLHLLAFTLIIEGKQTCWEQSYGSGIAY